MSYMRPVSPLDWFYGITKSYVIGTNKPNSEDTIIEDWGDIYEDNPSFIELIGTFIERECGDSDYSDKVVRTLSKKLECDHFLRPHKLSWEEFDVEHKNLHETLEFGEIAACSFEAIEDGIKERLSDAEILERIDEHRHYVDTIKYYRSRSE
jgi:hypothetical protein